jgi:hypothetical protein
MQQWTASAGTSMTKRRVDGLGTPLWKYKIKASEASMAELSKQVAELEEWAGGAMALLGQIFATLRLPANQKHIPPELQTIAHGWYEQYRELS